MSEAFFDDYEHFNYDQDKYVHSSHSGKQRSKREATENTNRVDSCGEFVIEFSVVTVTDESCAMSRTFTQVGTEDAEHGGESTTRAQSVVVRW